VVHLFFVFFVFVFGKISPDDEGKEEERRRRRRRRGRREKKTKGIVFNRGSAWGY
jgi:hypothetical protein